MCDYYNGDNWCLKDEKICSCWGDKEFCTANTTTTLYDVLKYIMNCENRDRIGIILETTQWRFKEIK